MTYYSAAHGWRRLWLTQPGLLVGASLLLVGCAVQPPHPVPARDPAAELARSEVFQSIAKQNADFERTQRELAQSGKDIREMRKQLDQIGKRWKHDRKGISAAQTGAGFTASSRHSPWIASGNASPKGSSATPEAHQGSIGAFEMIVDRGSGFGLGSMVVDNGTGSAAYVKLVSAAGVVSYAAYVPANSNGTIQRVDPGTYALWYCSGSGWQRQRRRFERDQVAVRAHDPFRFVEETDAAGVRYTRATVTLHRVLGGNMQTSRVAVSEFEELH